MHQSWGKNRHNPRLLMTIGLYSSASTWLFNVVRELMIAGQGEERVCATYSETAQAVLENRRALGRFVVWKMHYGDPSWDVLADLARPTILLSVRDPRDAIFSLTTRFKGTRFDVAANAMSRCCMRAIQCADAGHPVLRYEDGFFENESTLRALAAYLEAPVEDAVIASIFARYTPEAVKAFADNLDTLPPERLEGDPKIDIYDTLTHIHRGHIGDRRAGKWMDRLNPQQQRDLTAHFALFLQRFGYPLDHRGSTGNAIGSCPPDA
jgi:hypothetical protein